jgi:hypothetical protein
VGGRGNKYANERVRGEEWKAKEEQKEKEGKRKERTVWEGDIRTRRY